MSEGVDDRAVPHLKTQLRTEARPYEPKPTNAAALKEVVETSPRNNETAPARFKAVSKVVEGDKKTFGGRNGTNDPAEIRALQELLSASRFGDKLEVTGKMDAATTAAIKAFQQANGARGRDADGIVGPKTLKLLAHEYDLHTVREAKPGVAQPVAAQEDWKPFHERQGNGPVFDVLMPDGKRQPILINAQGDLKVPLGFQKTAANDERILQASLQNASDQGMSQKYRPFPLQGTLPSGSLEEPVPGMKPDVTVVRRDNVGGNPIDADGTAKARPAHVGTHPLAVSVDVRKTIEAAIGSDGIISAQPAGRRAHDATLKIADDLKRAGVVDANPTGADKKVGNSELGALAVLAEHLQSKKAGLIGNGNDGGRGSSGGGGGGVGGISVRS